MEYFWAILSLQSKKIQVIATQAGEGRQGNGQLVLAGQIVPGAPEYSVPDGFRGRVVHHHDQQQQQQHQQRRNHRDSNVATTTGINSQLEDAVRGIGRAPNNGGRSPNLTPSGRADIPIEHDDPEPTVEPEPGIGDQEEDIQEPILPEPEVPEPEPGYVLPPTEGVDGEPVEYEDTDQIICEEETQPGEEAPCGSLPSMTATSSIFEHQVSMISVPIPAVIDHVTSSNSKGGTFMSSSLPAMMPSSGSSSKHMSSSSSSSSSSSYSKTFISSGVVNMQHQTELPTLQMGSGCQQQQQMQQQQASFTYKCQMVYGPTKRTKICETVPVEATLPDCCSSC